MHILLVASDTATRNTLQKLFEAAGHKITAVGVTEVLGLKMPKTLDSALIDLNVEKMPEDDVKSVLSSIVTSVPTLVLYGSHLENEMKDLELGECEKMFKKGLVSDILEKLVSIRVTTLKAA